MWWKRRGSQLVELRAYSSVPLHLDEILSPPQQYIMNSHPRGIRINLYHPYFVWIFFVLYYLVYLAGVYIYCWRELILPGEVRQVLTQGLETTYCYVFVKVQEFKGYLNLLWKNLVRIFWKYIELFSKNLQNKINRFWPRMTDFSMI